MGSFDSGWVELKTEVKPVIPNWFIYEGIRVDMGNYKLFRPGRQWDKEQPHLSRPFVEREDGKRFYGEWSEGAPIPVATTEGEVIEL